MRKVFFVTLVLILALGLTVGLFGCENVDNYEQARQDLMEHLDISEGQSRFRFYEIDSNTFISTLSGDFQAGETITIGERDFRFLQRENVLHAWVDGEIYLLSCAYDRGVITDEDIDEFYRQFNAD